MKKWIVLSVCALLSGGALFAQQPSGNLSFEVASIKPAAPQQLGRIRIGMNADAGMLRYTNVSLKDVIREAYQVKDFQIQGPDWLGSDRFDIMAKLPSGATQDQIPEMLQSLLADRFKLSLHRDTKEHPIYALVAGKNGPKLKPPDTQMLTMMEAGWGGPKAMQLPDTKEGGPAPSKEPPPAEPKDAPGSAKAPPPDGPRRGPMMMAIGPDGMHLRAPSATLADIADLISRFTERPVVDMTGIQGRYSFDLAFAPETIRGLPRPMGVPPGKMGDGPEGAPAADSGSAPSIFDAVQQYGLKLEPRKAPLETLTIDHIEKMPTEN